MRLFLPLTIMFCLLMCSSHSLVEAQENKRAQAEREVAEELAIERRLMADLEVLKAQENELNQRQDELNAKSKAREKAKAKREKSRSQKVESKKAAKQESDDSNVSGTITINGKKMEFDGKDVEKWMHEHGRELESWADKHAHEWESWAEKFESHMEKWASGQEKQWDKWADKYSQRWEDWGAKLESGEIDQDEIGELVEKNLEMLSDMPLGDLIEGALKEGLGELENAPWESLGELHELVGGSVEHALKAMEQDIADSVGSELKATLGDLRTKELHSAIKKLQSSIESKQKKSGRDASGKLAVVQELLKQKGFDLKQRDAIARQVEHELLRAMELEKHAKDEAQQKEIAHMKMMMERLSGGKAKAAQAEAKAALEIMAKAQQAKSAEAAAHAHAQLTAKLFMTKDHEDLSVLKKSLEKQYAELKQQKDKLEDKESEIEKMRREIRELRKDVERMKKDK